jgi:putative addiction module component (TIGR02574 family)
MQLSSDALFEAALLLPEGERLELVSRIMETIPLEDVTMSIDDPGLKDELDRRFNDGSELIPWSEIRAEE